jgi:phosphoglycolate phosphatase-like HAD superfamily hydrolase
MTDAALAARYAPQLMLDRAEPYRPYAYGWTLFRAPGKSPSSKFEIEPAGALVLEYAIYYDWDIGHLYDLEHVWVHVGEDGSVIKVEASSHGGRKLMDIGNDLPEFASASDFLLPSSLPGLSGQSILPNKLDHRDKPGGDEGGAASQATHPIIYAEAGKHAHWASPSHMSDADRQKLTMVCSRLTGLDGVLLTTPLGDAGAYSATAADHRLARLRMQADAFSPSFSYAPLETLPVLLPWPELEAEIPQRIRTELAALRESQPHFAAIFLDCGDTLIDERTEEKLPGSEVVTRADLIPGAKQMMDDLKARGHKLILVADGPRQTFVNMLTHHGLWNHFDAHIISEDVGVHKPDAQMFDAALAAAGLTRDDTWRTVMIGNNLSRDINGANALGITSVFMSWSTLRTHVAADPSEVPDYHIKSPSEFAGLLDHLETALQWRFRHAQR